MWKGLNNLDDMYKFLIMFVVMLGAYALFNVIGDSGSCTYCLKKYGPDECEKICECQNDSE